MDHISFADAEYAGKSVEREIVALLNLGPVNKEIAGELSMSEVPSSSTVDNPAQDANQVLARALRIGDLPLAQRHSL